MASECSRTIIEVRGIWYRHSLILYWDHASEAVMEWPYGWWIAFIVAALAGIIVPWRLGRNQGFTVQGFAALLCAALTIGLYLMYESAVLDFGRANARAGGGALIRIDLPLHWFLMFISLFSCLAAFVASITLAIRPYLPLSN